jgi:hypothetical protein
VNCGDSQTYTFPNAGYRIIQVLVDGVNNTAAVSSGIYTFNNVTSNHTITVTVADLPVTFIAFAIGEGLQVALHRTVSLHYMFADGVPTHFRVAESMAALSSPGGWQEYKTSNLKYTFVSEENGEKTVYTQLKNEAGETDIKSASIFYKPLSPRLILTSLSINNNAISTNNRTVTLNHTVENGTPALYSVSENSAQVGKIWLPYVKTPLFELSEGVGLKDVYFVIANSTDTSNIATAQIYLDESVTIEGNGLVAKLFPNPVQDYLTVVVENATQPVKITVYNIMGNAVLSQTFSTSTFSIDLSRCVPGMLVVRIQCGDKYVIKKIIKL